MYGQGEMLHLSSCIIDLIAMTAHERKALILPELMAILMAMEALMGYHTAKDIRKRFLAALGRHMASSGTLQNY